MSLYTQRTEYALSVSATLEGWIQTTQRTLIHEIYVYGLWGSHFRWISSQSIESESMYEKLCLSLFLSHAALHWNYNSNRSFLTCRKGWRPQYSVLVPLVLPMADDGQIILVQFPRTLNASNKKGACKMNRQTALLIKSPYSELVLQQSIPKSMDKILNHG